MSKQDWQWWVGAFASAVGGALVTGLLPHPWDKIGAAFAAAGMAFSAYKITPGDSVKK
jgi:hypothetical protein